MTIRLPDDLERFVRAEVDSGRFASQDEAVAEAVRLLQSQLVQAATRFVSAPTPTTTPDPLLGALREAADEIDDIVAETMRLREQQPWRPSLSE